MATKHKKSQRALAFFAAITGMDKERADSLLADAGYPPIADTSWKMLTTRYVPLFKAMPSLMANYAEHPKSIAQLIADTAMALADEHAAHEIHVDFEDPSVA